MNSGAMLSDSLRPVSASTFQYVLGSTFIVFALLPWLNFGLTDFDTQPWALLAALAFLSLLKRHFLPSKARVFAYFMVFSIVVAAILSFSASFSMAIRSLVSFVSFVACFIAFYNYLVRYGPPLKLVLTLNVFWLLAAVPQVFFDPFLYADFVQTRTNEGRGVTSLAAEPTYFAAFILFLSWIVLVITNWKPSGRIRLLLFLNIFAILFVAKSAMIWLYFTIALIVFILVSSLRGKIFWGVTAFFLAPLLLFLGGYFLDGSRVANLAQELSSGLFQIINRDASINSRVGHAMLSLHASVSNLGLPGGFGTFPETARDINTTVFNDFFYRGLSSSRIMSHLGTFFFELGLGAGLLFVWFIFYCTGVRNLLQVAQGILFTIFLIGALPVNLPLIPMLLALWIYKRRIEQRGVPTLASGAQSI